MKRLLSLFLLLALVGCYKVPDTIEPQFNFAIQDRYLKQLPAAFAPLSSQEMKEEWGKEYTIAQKFAQELDLYRAVTTFKRAEFLLPEGNSERLEEIQYQILLSYYLGKRYDAVTQTFNHSTLYHATTSFPAYHDLLIIVYESYLQTQQEEKAHYVLRVIEHHYPDTAKRLQLSTALTDGDISSLQQKQRTDPSQESLSHLLNTYDAKKKSVSKAQWTNAIIPGMGYLYVGQKQSALTSFLLNGLFIAAATHFYVKGQIAAGIITTSFEAGWYFGGIYGAGEAAKLYNERLYEQGAHSALTHHKLYPVLMLNYGF